MEAWFKDGSLPDGASGIARARKIETSSGENLVARDADERHWLMNIRNQQEAIERARSGRIGFRTSEWNHKPMIDVPSYDGTLQLVLKEGSDDFLHYAEGSSDGETMHDYLSRGNNLEEEIERQVAFRQMLVRSAYSKIHVHRWRVAVEERDTSVAAPAPR
jgi:hypothetical protein